MANVILFTDRSPDSSTFTVDSFGWNSKLYTLPAGAYKLAAHLREKGYSVLVVPNCLSYSLQGIQEIVKNNSQDLLWAGVSTTFLTVKTPLIDQYRQAWSQDSSPVLLDNVLYNTVSTFQAAKQLAWGSTELNLISAWLKKEFNAQLLIGGAWVTTIKNGNLFGLNDNCYIVSGRAELYVENFTKLKLADPNVTPEYVNNNADYDDHHYRYSQMKWNQYDFIKEDDWLPLEISRGCAFNCAFCDYDRKSSFDNYKDPDSLLQEILQNYYEHGVTKFQLLDDLYNDSKQKVRELYDKVWSKLPFTPEWSSFMRLDMMWSDPESADFIKASGARFGSFGIETLHDRAGKKVGKGLGRARILETLAMLKEKWGNDTLVSGMFIIGLPFEPRESILSTIDWATKTDLLYNYHFTPMWITPPSHFDMLSKFHTISLNNDNYGIKWIEPNNWINTEGITFNEADQLMQQANSKNPSGFNVNFGNYPDLRNAGFSHYEIASMKTNPALDLRVREANIIKNQKINERIKSVLSLKGI